MDNNRRLVLKSVGLGSCLFIAPSFSNEVIGEITKENGEDKMNVYNQENYKIMWGGVELDGWVNTSYIKIQPSNNLK
jgi:hypothetical protein